ncbi:MAG: hypothetical protein U9R28_11230 [Pseudomonadota bacterium]|nr:hypothetical protein [Pseudomonadota bacterium]
MVKRILFLILGFMPFSISASQMCVVSSGSDSLIINGTEYQTPAVLVECCRSIQSSQQASFCFGDTGKCKDLKAGESFDFSRNDGFCSEKIDLGILLKLKRILMAEPSTDFAMHRGIEESLALPSEKILKHKGSIKLEPKTTISVAGTEVINSKTLEILDLPLGMHQVKLCRENTCNEQKIEVIKMSPEIKADLENLSRIEKRLYFLKRGYFSNAYSQ